MTAFLFPQIRGQSKQCTEVRFASFLSGGFITTIVVNPPERKLAKRRDGDISWTMTSRGHYFSKWVISRGHSQRVTFRGHFW